MKKNSHSQSPDIFLAEEQLRDLLEMLGIIVTSGTFREIIAYCPFHSNKDSPAFNISLLPGHLWKCHNGKCNKTGNIVTLLTMKGYTRNEAEKMLIRGSYEISDLSALVERLMADPNNDSKEEWREINVAEFQSCDKECGYPARKYMRGRGISTRAYDFFGMGYSQGKHMAVIPVFDERGRLSGVIGRELSSKRYQYSTGLGRGELIWNLHNARKCENIILTEGSLDAVYVWQAGFENVGAVLGSAISPRQWKQLRKHFTEIICFFDNDEAGMAITETIVNSIHDMAVSYVEYPRDVKDPGELTKREIRSMIEHRKTSLDLLLNRI